MSENDNKENKETKGKMNENDNKDDKEKKINSVLGTQFVNFLLSQKNKTDRQNLADESFHLYSSFCKAGFNKEESLQLLIAMMQSVIESMFTN